MGGGGVTYPLAENYLVITRYIASTTLSTDDTNIVIWLGRRCIISTQINEEMKYNNHLNGK